MPSFSVAIPTVASLLSSRSQSKAAQSAADSQSAASMASIDEQRRQFDALQALLKPYTDAGVGAIGEMGKYAQAGLPAMQAQMDLIGLGGADAQRAALEQISNSPEMLAMMQQGENAILQNASATGGLRGGNTMGALMQMRPSVLNGLVNQQYGRLGGFTQMGLQTQQNLAQLGQASAAGTGAAGMQSANNIGQLLAQHGAAQAGNALAQGRAQQGMFGALEKGWGIYQGMQNPNTPPSINGPGGIYGDNPYAGY